jgi:hypothetical protein
MLGAPRPHKTSLSVIYNTVSIREELRTCHFRSSADVQQIEVGENRMEDNHYLHPACIRLHFESKLSVASRKTMDSPATKPC